MRLIGLAVLTLSFILASLARETQASTYQEALQALQGLNSVTQAGLSLAEYEPRVLDAKVVADRYLGVVDPGQARQQGAVAKALGLHLTARSWWRYTVMPNEVLGRAARIRIAPSRHSLRAIHRAVSRGDGALQRQAQEIQAQISARNPTPASGGHPPCG